MTAEEFKNLYQDINGLVTKIKELSGTATSFLSEGVDLLSDEFNYEFVENSSLKQQLIGSCKRMIVARIGYLHSDRNSAFEDFSRAIQIQIEGLVNTWFNQYYIKNGKSVEIFAIEYVILKSEQFFGKDISNFKKILDDRYQNLNDFYSDYIKLDKKDFRIKYYDTLKDAGFRIDDFNKKVFKVNFLKPDGSFQNIEKISYLNKIEFVFLFEYGTSNYFTFNPINRLNEFRNAVLSHAGLGYDPSQYYYKELYGVTNRFELLIKAFAGLYGMVSKRTVPVIVQKEEYLISEEVEGSASDDQQLTSSDTENPVKTQKQNPQKEFAAKTNGKKKQSKRRK